jgi:hypothetical protein
MLRPIKTEKKTMRKYLELRNQDWQIEAVCGYFTHMPSAAPAISRGNRTRDLPKA